MAITIALMMTAFAGMVGLSVDLADWYGTRRAMQSAVDAAALGGAREMLNGGTSAQVTTAATTDGNLNASGLARGGTFNIQPNMAAQTVTVTMTKSADVFLSGLFLGSTPTITVTAEAGLITTAPAQPEYCLRIMSPNAAGALTLSGSSSIQASGCPIAVNSTSATAINLSGNTRINSKSICGPGGSIVSGSSVLSPGETSCSAATDPYANMTPPSNVNDPCQYTNYTINNNNTATYINSSGQTVTINGTYPQQYSTIPMSPGVYCGGINIAGNGGDANVSFGSGVYVIRNGGLIAGNSTTASGTGVSFYLTGTGGVSMSNSTNFSITAPTSGEMAGIAIYQDQSEPAGTITENLSGNSTLTFTGLLYFGNQNVSVSGSSEDQSAAFTWMVAYTLNYSGYSTLYLNSNYSKTTVPQPTGTSSTLAVALLQ
jgi:hypothetical protein